MILSLILLALLLFTFFNSPKLGRIPNKEHLERIAGSSHYRKGSFRNLLPTAQITAEGGKFKLFASQLFSRPERLRPRGEIPTVKSDLRAIPPDEEMLIWFGHSSYYLQAGGLRMLVDPLFSDRLSPIPGFGKAFRGTHLYAADEMPEIDCLLITHDHWDHLNYESLRALRSRVKRIICPLGVGAHLIYWGYDPERITEADWYAEIPLADGCTLHTVPSRHFSGRWLKPNQTLWSSFVLQTPNLRLFLGGDGGYGPHFAEAGERFGGFDLALLENGQYNSNWKYIHLFPEQVLEAAKDLRARRILPIHSGRFALARHPWDEPLSRLSKLADDRGQMLVTPRIGEPVRLRDSLQTFSRWWETVE